MAGTQAQLMIFVDEIDEALTEIATGADGADEKVLESLLLRANLILRDILVVEDMLPGGEVLCNAVCSVIRCLQEAVDEKNLSHMRGRPSICIPEEQLAMLLGYHFKLTDIARVLMVSPRTIRRRIIQFGLEDAASYIYTWSPVEARTIRTLPGRRWRKSSRMNDPSIAPAWSPSNCCIQHSS